jgi:signal transduction histidine kinase
VPSPERESELARHYAQELARDRKWVADELHDDALQAMGAVLLRLGILGRQLTDPEQQALIEQLELSTRETIARLRAVIARLQDMPADRPPPG